MSFFSLMSSEAMQMCLNKRNFLHEKRIQSPQDFFCTPKFHYLVHQYNFGRRRILTPESSEKIPLSKTVKIMS